MNMHLRVGRRVAAVTGGMDGIVVALTKREFDVVVCDRTIRSGNCRKPGGPSCTRRAYVFSAVHTGRRGHENLKAQGLPTPPCLGNGKDRRVRLRSGNDRGRYDEAIKEIRSRSLVSPSSRNRSPIVIVLLLGISRRTDKRFAIAPLQRLSFFGHFGPDQEPN